MTHAEKTQYKSLKFDNDGYIDSIPRHLAQSQQAAICSSAPTNYSFADPTTSFASSPVLHSDGAQLPSIATVLTDNSSALVNTLHHVQHTTSSHHSALEPSLPNDKGMFEQAAFFFKVIRNLFLFAESVFSPPFFISALDLSLYDWSPSSIELDNYSSNVALPNTTEPGKDCYICTAFVCVCV